MNVIFLIQTVYLQKNFWSSWKSNNLLYKIISKPFLFEIHHVLEMNDIYIPVS